MCDTNWCTFCDCAVSSISNSIYCSEKCFKLDALTHHSLYTPNVAEKPKVSATTDPIMMSSATQQLHTDQYTPSRRDSSDYTGSSVASEDLAAMYFDLVPCTSPTQLQLTTKTPPLLLTSVSSPASSHEDPVLSFTTLSYSLCINEKLPTAIMTQYVQPRHHA